MRMIVLDTNRTFVNPRAERSVRMSTISFSTPVRLSAPQRLVATSDAESTPAPRDGFLWSKALELPAYTYGVGAAALSGLYGYAQRFPYGGVTINPNGIVLNPEWTRHFAPDTLAGQAQPILAGVAAGLCLLRGGFEYYEGVKHNDSKAFLASTLDIALAGASVMQLVHPAGGAAAALALAAARGVLEAHQG